MRFIIAIFLFINSASLFAQEKPEGFTVVETMPQFQGGSVELMKFIQKSVTYPKIAKDNGFVGKSYIKFVVTDSGKIENCEVLKSSGYEILDAEALRVINIMPLWSPGKQNEKAVNVAYSIPINFSLGSGFSPSKAADKQTEEYILEMGLIYLNGGFFQKAITCFDRYISLNKSNAVAWLSKGASYYNLKKEKEACECWSEAYKLGNKEAGSFMKEYCHESKEVFESIEKMPEFPGGTGELMKFIQKNIKYPEGVKKSDVLSSKVYLKFVINSDGSLSNIEVNKSSGNNFVDEEAKRIVGIMPKWNSGEQNGKKVSVYFNLPISFSKYN